jgi:SAM-dependent methyltransferase
MPTWDELFRRGIAIEGLAMEVAMMARLLALDFGETPSKIKIWDVGCGTGRHAVYLARLGFDVYASDNSPKALEKTREALKLEHVKATVAEADMEELPFKGVQFHGIILWNVIQHADLAKITRVMTNLKGNILPKGLFLLSMKSTKSEEVGRGKRVEENTYVLTEGAETGVPHHYFSRAELERLLAPFQVIHLVESQEDYLAVAYKTFIAKDTLPYHNAHWVVMGKKPGEPSRKF